MENTVLIRAEKGVGYMTLNRPEALHALNRSMCEKMLAALKGWAADPDIYLVMIDHAAGSRGFCAGGDIVMLRQSGLGDGAEARAFFTQEYRLNAAIKAFPKPYLAIMDGVTMGGGVGLSVHGSHRIATEKTLFAMPETGIGLFPDVGGGWFLPRLQGELGTWLALTGARLKGRDVTAAGLATHFLPSELVANFKKQLAEADFAGAAAELLGELLSRSTHAVPAGSYQVHMAEINDCFQGDCVETIMRRLQASGSDWSRVQLESLARKSPETLKLTLRQLRLGASHTSFEEHMKMEYRIGARKVHSADFIEGVRAVILDKDHAPVWSPTDLQAVTQAQIDAYFAPLEEGELRFD